MISVADLEGLAREWAEIVEEEGDLAGSMISAAGHLAVAETDALASLAASSIDPADMADPLFLASAMVKNSLMIQLPFLTASMSLYSTWLQMAWIPAEHVLRREDPDGDDDVV